MKTTLLVLRQFQNFNVVNGELNIVSLYQKKIIIGVRFFQTQCTLGCCVIFSTFSDILFY